MPVGLVMVIPLMAVVVLAAAICFASLRITTTIRLGDQSPLSPSVRQAMLLQRRGARLSLIPEIGPPFLATVQVPTRSAALRSSQRCRRRGWKEWRPWNT